MMTELLHQPIQLDEIQVAQRRLRSSVLRSPLVRLNVEDAPAEIYLKLENLQPTGSFKLRGAGNAMAAAGKEKLADGVWTASAGNMAQSLAWHARRMGVACTAVVPDDAPEVKIAAIARLGARIVKVPFPAYQEIQRLHTFEGMAGMLVHPFGDPAVMAGNGTIGLEILEDLPDVNAILVPYGGGGLSCGIASAIRLVSPQVKVYACEVQTAAPLAASLAASSPVEVSYTPSFVSGIGAPFVFPEMWPLAELLLDGSLVVSLAQVAEAIRLMAGSNHLIAEGAGAVPVGAAMAGLAGGGKIACVLSGGNIDKEKLIRILQGYVPDKRSRNTKYPRPKGPVLLWDGPGDYDPR